MAVKMKRTLMQQLEAKLLHTTCSGHSRTTTHLMIASESSQRTFADVEPSLRTPSSVPCFSVSFEQHRPPTLKPRSVPPSKHNTGQTYTELTTITQACTNSLLQKHYTTLSKSFIQLV